MKSGFFDGERREKFERFYCACLCLSCVVCGIWLDNGIAEFEVMNL
jgi:hypothetical protein